MNIMNFEGKTAIVTGASAGIGRATATMLAQNGCNVVLVDIDQKNLEAICKENEKCSGKSVFFECDISDENAVNEVVKKTEMLFGKIDILVNNAGIWRYFGPFSESESSLWKKMIDVNLLGTMYFTRAVINGMTERRYGRIINVGSVAGVYGNANMSIYSATKGAVISFTKALAKEVADKNVLVNCVSPGTVSNTYDEPEPNELSYMGRSGTHSENAKLICFLAGDDAAYISGQNIQIDGCRRKI